MCCFMCSRFSERTQRWKIALCRDPKKRCKDHVKRLLLASSIDPLQLQTLGAGRALWRSTRLADTASLKNTRTGFANSTNDNVVINGDHQPTINAVAQELDWCLYNVHALIMQFMLTYVSFLSTLIPFVYTL